MQYETPALRDFEKVERDREQQRRQERARQAEKRREAEAEAEDQRKEAEFDEWWASLGTEEQEAFKVQALEQAVSHGYGFHLSRYRQDTQSNSGRGYLRRMLIVHYIATGTTEPPAAANE